MEADHGVVEQAGVLVTSPERSEYSNSKEIQVNARELSHDVSKYAHE